MTTTRARIVQPSTYSTPEGYFPIPIGLLRLDLTTEFDLYLPCKYGRKPVLYRKGHLSFTEEARERLKANDLPYLLVRSGQRDNCQSYIESNLGAILSDPSLPVEVRSTVLYDSARGVIEDVMKEPRLGENLQRSIRVVEDAIDFLYREKSAFRCLLRITSYDYYTFTHSVNVFVFSTALAQRLSFPEDQVREFGEGALLHDIGKSMVDPAIINKGGKLTAEEWDQVKKHPAHGQGILEELGVTSEIALDVTRHHHEKLTGYGYPDALRENDLSPWVRVCTIADIFDALTTKRSYSHARKSFWALHLMKTEMEDELDAQFFREFVGMLGQGQQNALPD